jgi:flagellar biosynthetic protein FliQ
MLMTALVVGLLISVVQALTQINEVTLSFVPKILAVFAAMAVAGPWLISTMLTYTVTLFNSLPAMVIWKLSTWRNSPRTTLTASCWRRLG